MKDNIITNDPAFTKCWSCDTVYDYMIHEVCPICESHWLDSKHNHPPLKRVSVDIDYQTGFLTPIIYERI